MDIIYKTLSTRSAEVIKHFTDLNHPAFILDEAYLLRKTSTKDAVKKLMRDMIKRGLLLHLKEGVYWIIPYEASDACPVLSMPQCVNLYVIPLISCALYFDTYTADSRPRPEKKRNNTSGANIIGASASNKLTPFLPGTAIFKTLSSTAMQTTKLKMRRIALVLTKLYKTNRKYCCHVRSVVTV